MKLVYFINGWRYGSDYFLSFGWTKEQIARMIDGEVIVRDGNEFRIVVQA